MVTVLLFNYEYGFYLQLSFRSLNVSKTSWAFPSLYALGGKKKKKLVSKKIKKKTLAKVDPRPSDSMVMVLVLRCRIWSISSSQNLAPSSSSSMSAPYAPRLNRSSISFLESCCWIVYKKRTQEGIQMLHASSLLYETV